MKIAYILYPGAIISNKSNGIRSQAETWAKSLRELGHDVDLVQEWGNYNWKDYDIIHFFGPSYGGWFNQISSQLMRFNKDIVYSPIIDPTLVRNPLIRAARIIRRKCLGLLGSYRKQYDNARLLFTRSKCEYEYLVNDYKIEKDKVCIVPLAYSSIYSQVHANMDMKEDYVFHMSSLTQPRKNVMRLVEAAKKYGFKLVLAGKLGSGDEKQRLLDFIGDSTNIDVRGFIDEETKIELYKKAKVFVLPSLQEGVGIVALDASLFGCEIVITSIPGPKDYYNGKCFIVDPYNVDSIGHGIIEALKGKFQPELGFEVRATYSNETITNKLVDCYLSIKK